MTTVYAVDQIFVIAADAFARCSANPLLAIAHTGDSDPNRQSSPGY